MQSYCKLDEIQNKLSDFNKLVKSRKSFSFMTEYEYHGMTKISLPLEIGDISHAHRANIEKCILQKV